MSHPIDITGFRSGRLVAIRRADSDGGHARWVARCDCGNEIVTTGRYIRTGHTKSCGCLKRDLLSERKIKHGDSGRSRLYSIWGNMRTRCYNPKSDDYSRYGYRGIAVCSEWDDYSAFKQWALSNGYRDDLTIERDNNSQGYNPSNCRWIPNGDQAANRDKNIIVEYGGEARCIARHARDVGLKVGTVYARIYRGFTVKEALELPVYGRRRK